MFKKLKEKSEGFTIIEVLIVLAIAGLIMLIVFMAVPALQRNSRNTQIRNSAGAVLGGINDFISNNNGRLPQAIDDAPDGTVTIRLNSGGNNATAKVQAGYVVDLVDGSSGATPPMPLSTGEIKIVLNRKCNSTSTGFGTITRRSYSAGFLIETGSASTGSQCIES